MTLTEILIAVLFILLLGVVVFPRITHSQLVADEGAALDSLRSVYLAEQEYIISHPDVGFTSGLTSLGNTSQAGGSLTIDQKLATGRKNGYTFIYTPGEKVNGAIRSYTITGVPDRVGTTGQRRFFSDESGEIHYNAAGPADVASPVIQ